MHIPLQTLWAAKPNSKRLVRNQNWTRGDNPRFMYVDAIVYLSTVRLKMYVSRNKLKDTPWNLTNLTVIGDDESGVKRYIEQRLYQFYFNHDSTLDSVHDLSPYAPLKIVRKHGHRSTRSVYEVIAHPRNPWISGKCTVTVTHIEKQQ